MQRARICCSTEWTHLKHRRPSGPANRSRRLLFVQINFLTSLLKTVLMCVTGQSESSRLCLDRRLLCYQNSVLRHVSSRRPTSFVLEHIPPRLAALQHFTTNVNLSSDVISSLGMVSHVHTARLAVYF